MKDTTFLLKKHSVHSLFYRINFTKMLKFGENVLSTTCILVLSVVILLISYLKWCFQYWAQRNVPMVKDPTIPFGHIQNPWKRKINTSIHLKEGYDIMKRRGHNYFGVFHIWVPFFIPVSLDLIKAIMAKDFVHFTDRGFYNDATEDTFWNNIILVGGSRWRHLRTKFTPIFTSVKMKKIFPTLLECCSVMENNMHRFYESGKPVNAKEIFSSFGIDVIGSCAFGLECHSLQSEDCDFKKHGKTVFNKYSKQFLIKQACVMLFPKISKMLRLKMFEEESLEFFTKVVDEVVTYRKNNNYYRNDFLQLLIDMKDDQAMSLRDMASQSYAFFAAGYETSSSAMTFLMYELALQPDIQEKARTEIKNTIKEYDGLTFEAIKSLKYLNQVLEETLRKYPPFGIITRECVKEYKVPNSDVVIEKGAKVAIPVWAIHYDEDFYPNANNFDPDRFSEANKQDRDPYTHIPFGEGPRQCLGMKFAYMETKLGVATLLKSFKFSLNKNTKVPLTVVPNALSTTPDADIWIDVEKCID